MNDASIIFIVGMSIAGCLAICILGMRFAEREQIRRQQVKLARQDAGGMRAEVDALKARVEVLERLALDEDRRLAGEINRLGTSAGTNRQV